MTPQQFADSLVAAFADSNAERYFAHFHPDATFLFHDAPGRIESRSAYEAMWAGVGARGRVPGPHMQVDQPTRAGAR